MARLAVAVGIPLLLTCLLAAVWVQSGRIRLFGDEPHYVIIAESLVRDGDVELRNNHALEERFPTYVGEVAPHAFVAGHRWYPMHGPGLGVLIAPGLIVGGVLGARLTTCALAALLPLTMFLWLAGLLGRRDAMWLTLAATLSIPYVFGAVHLYPDPVAAALAAPLLLLLAHAADGQRRKIAWAAFWLVNGLLPTLMVTFLAPSIVLAMFALARPLPPLRRLPGRNDVGHNDVVRTAPLFLVGPLILAAAWCALYASLLVPNLLQIIPFGGASPSGRFAWPAAWLWLVPLAVTFSWHRDQLERFFRPVLLVVFAYQAALALRWLPSPMTMTNAFTPELALRNSLFPVGMRAWLPSFYSSDFLSFPPNVVAIVALLLLLASGPVLGFRLARSRSSD